ncbi:MAG TPA: hypothetical protein ENK57_17255 [Polyangiaceae bacterium]|nr:hypothetical protein [Polyangiaceae bacterium]
MPNYRTTVLIPVPLDLTFNYIRDFQHAENWDPRVSAARRLDGGGDNGVGARFELDSPGPLFTTLRFVYELVRCVPDERLTFRGQTCFASYEDDLRFEALDPSTTQLRYEAQFDLRGVLWLGTPIMSVLFQRIGSAATAGIPSAVVHGTGRSSE